MIIQITFLFFSWIVCLCLLIWRNSKEISWRQILCFHIILCLFYIKKHLFLIYIGNLFYLCFPVPFFLVKKNSISLQLILYTSFFVLYYLFPISEIWDHKYICHIISFNFVSYPLILSSIIQLKYSFAYVWSRRQASLLFV